ncbi:MAG TPA: DUF6599 family protein [Vicinamibacteria bacterium]|nr:DUF6599 family protein [Vicinamibacteria bacterium]
MLTSLVLAGAASAVSLAPRAAGGWSRPAEPRSVSPAEIFSYMDGAGELYLGYRLSRLEVYEYTSPMEGPILLELYWLESSDDGYGLLSGDWEGEPVRLDDTWPSQPPRALYGAGLLRAWSFDLYVRILASQETPAAKAAVLELGRAVVAGRPVVKPPEMVTTLPDAVAGEYRLRLDRVTFLRSPLVLNSTYFLATENLLDLGPAAEAVVATYERRGEAAEEPARLRALVVRYPTEDAARAALAHFQAGYLRPAAAAPGGSGVAEQVEDGWLAGERSGRRLAFVFQAREAATAAAAVAQLRPAAGGSDER